MTDTADVLLAYSRWFEAVLAARERDGRSHEELVDAFIASLPVGSPLDDAVSGAGDVAEKGPDWTPALPPIGAPVQWCAVNDPLIEAGTYAAVVTDHPNPWQVGLAVTIPGRPLGSLCPEGPKYAYRVAELGLVSPNGGQPRPSFWRPIQ